MNRGGLLVVVLLVAASLAFASGSTEPAAAAKQVTVRLSLFPGFTADDSPDPATVSAILTENVRWVVADQDHPAPPEIQSHWRLAFQAGRIRVYDHESTKVRKHETRTKN